AKNNLSLQLELADLRSAKYTAALEIYGPYHHAPLRAFLWDPDRHACTLRGHRSLWGLAVSVLSRLAEIVPAPQFDFCVHCGLGPALACRGIIDCGAGISGKLRSQSV